MGQRHQIYVKFPENVGIGGFHHQWLYGMNAIESLNRVVEFYHADSEDKYGPLKSSTGYGLDRQSQVIASLYSTCVKTGYWHYIHNFVADEVKDALRESREYKTPTEILDPRNGDNNDGITIIDVSKGDFRYCFMNIGHLEGEVNPKKLKPLSAREYLLCYYPEFFNKLGRLDWQLKRDTGGVKRRPIIDKEFDLALHSLLNIEEKAKLLTLAECKKLFPAMYDLKEKSNVIKLRGAK